MGRDIKEIPEDVLDCFYYDESSPSCLRWKIKPSKWLKIEIGDVAGCLEGQGYWVVKCYKSVFKVHRIVYSLHHRNIPDNRAIDHVDRNRGNNKISNLRVVEWKTNAQNQSKHSDNVSGVTGVSLQSGRGDYWSWIAVCRMPCGKIVRKTFGIEKYGNATAFEMAVAARTKMLEQANEQGSQYSINHGK